MHPFDSERDGGEPVYRYHEPEPLHRQLDSDGSEGLSSLCRSSILDMSTFGLDSTLSSLLNSLATMVVLT